MQHFSTNSFRKITALRSFLIKAMGLRLRPLWNLFITSNPNQRTQTQFTKPPTKHKNIFYRVIRVKYFTFCELWQGRAWQAHQSTCREEHPNRHLWSWTSWTSSSWELQLPPHRSQRPPENPDNIQRVNREKLRVKWCDSQRVWSWSFTMVGELSETETLGGRKAQNLWICGR